MVLTKILEYDKSRSNCLHFVLRQLQPRIQLRQSTCLQIFQPSHHVRNATWMENRRQQRTVPRMPKHRKKTAMTTKLTPQQKIDVENIIIQQHDAIKAVRAIANLLNINLLEANKIYSTFKNEKTK